MKTGFIAFLVFLFCLYSHRAFSMEDSQYLKQADDLIKGISNITHSTLSELFRPSVHFREKEFTLTVIPVYYSVERLYRMERSATDYFDLTGKDFSGFGFGFTAVYGLTDSVSLSASLLGNRSSGSMMMEVNNPFDNYIKYFSLKGDYSLYSLNCSAGYDFLDSSVWSLPLSYGLMVQYHKASISFSPYNRPIADVPLTIISADSFALTDYLILAVSRKFYPAGLEIQLTPYLVAIHPLANLINGKTRFGSPKPYLIKPDIRLKVTDPNGTSRVIGEMIDIEQEGGSFLPGLMLSYSNPAGFSVAVSISGVLSSTAGFYNDIFLYGSRMKIFSLVLTYRFSD